MSMTKRKRYPREWKWPGGAKIALSVGMPFEAFERQSQVNYVATKGAIDRFSLSYGDYGWKAGVWRILNIVDEYGIKVSASTNGLAAERNPDIVGMLVEDGHEVNGHGWANDVYAKDATREEEEAEIIRCTEMLARACGGVRPVGWISPGSSGSEHTVELLAKHGYTWFGDDASDDLPFTVSSAGGPLVIMPRANMYMNDISTWIFPQNPTSVFVENFKNTFDQLYREGEEGNPKWISMTLHAHMAGRPTFSNAIRQCLDYARKHDGVFYTRNRDIAEWALHREKGE
jgi:peptidoglycan/xylan/chitin deacetylase (PgdA/CDA1 family)